MQNGFHECQICVKFQLLVHSGMLVYSTFYANYENQWIKIYFPNSLTVISKPLLVEVLLTDLV